MELKYEVLPIDNIFDSPENWQKLNSFSDDELCRMLVKVAKTLTYMLWAPQHLKKHPKSATQDDVWRAYANMREKRKLTNVYYIEDENNPMSKEEMMLVFSESDAFNELLNINYVDSIRVCMQNMLHFASYETIAKRYFGQTGEWLSEKCEKALCLILSFTPEECDIIADATIDVLKKAIAYRDAMIALVEKRGLEVY